MRPAASPFIHKATPLRFFICDFGAEACRENVSRNPTPAIFVQSDLKSFKLKFGISI